MPDQVIHLGEAWAGSSVNCVAFRHEAIVRVEGGCVVSFYDTDGNVVLQHIDHAFVPQRRLTIVCPVVPHDAHNCISLGVDPSGTVHAVFGAHSSIAYHVRVPPLLDIAAAEAVPLGGRPHSRFTYPTLLRDPRSGELRLLYREGGPWAGELRVKRWNSEVAAFVDDEVPLLSGQTCQPTAGPYINRPVILPDGRVALFCVWRLARDATTAGEVANTGLDLVVATADLRSLSSLDGVGLTLPVTPVHAPRTWAVPAGANLINQGAAACGADGSPMALTYWNDATGVPQYHMLWLESGAWRAAAVSCFITRFSLQGLGTLPLPHSRPVLLVRRDGLALCVFRSAEYGNRLMLTLIGRPYGDPGDRRTVVLLDEDLGFYEPAVDHSAFEQDGSLVMYVQACAQDQGDRGRGREGAPARLVRWSGARVDGWEARSGEASAPSDEHATSKPTPR